MRLVSLICLVYALIISLYGKKINLPPSTMELAILAYLSEILHKIEKFTIITSVLVMAGITIINMITRTFFQYNLSFIEEMSQVLIIAITFIGTAYAARQGRHIRMSAIYDQFDQQIRKIVMLITTLVTAIIFLVLCWWSIRYVFIMHRLGTFTPSLHIPYYIIYLVCPIGFFMSGVQYLLAFIQNLKSDEIYLSYDEKEHQRERPNND